VSMRYVNSNLSLCRKKS